MARDSQGAELAREEQPITFGQAFSSFMQKVTHCFTHANKTMKFSTNLTWALIASLLFYRPIIKRSQSLILSPLIRFKRTNHVLPSTKALTFEWKPIQQQHKSHIMRSWGENNGMHKSFLSPSPPLSNFPSCYMWRKVLNLCILYVVPFFYHLAP